MAAAGRAALRLWDALQPQRQAGFQGLAVVFNLQNGGTSQGARLVWGETAHVRTESPLSPPEGALAGSGRGVQGLRFCNSDLQAQGLGRTRHSYV